MEKGTSQSFKEFCECVNTMLHAIDILLTHPASNVEKREEAEDLLIKASKGLINELERQKECMSILH